MYVPRHFAMTPGQVADLLAGADRAQLVTAHPTGPVATLLPTLWRPGDDDGGDLGSLVFHVTRTNDQWRDRGAGEALAILSGPDGYVAPQWMASFAHDPDVPTWNYVTVHAYGELEPRDPAWTRWAVDELSGAHGFDTGLVDPDAMERMLRAIVGLELRITRVQAKAKLSQHRSPEDVAGIIEGLRGSGADALASAMADIALPHAHARYELIGEIRARRGAGRAAGG